MPFARILLASLLVSTSLLTTSLARADDKSGVCDGFAALGFSMRISPEMKSRIQDTAGDAVEASSWPRVAPVKEARESVYPIGQGQAGGKVSKVVPWDGAKPYVRKEYFTEASFENDVLALGYLRKVAGSDSQVKIVKTLEVKPPTTLHLDYVEGKTLNSVLSDVRATESSKSSAILAYAGFLTQLRKAISQRPEVTNIEAVQVPGLDGMTVGLKFQVLVKDFVGNLKSTNVFIKSDNILVEEKTGRLILIDPF